VVDPLASQGSLVYSSRHRRLIAVNSGSNTVSVLGLDANRLRLRQVLGSSDAFPVSATIHGDLLYVLNARDGGSITGFRLTGDQFIPIVASTRNLQLDRVGGPAEFLNTPGQISFSPDGKRLVVTTKANRGLIDVFTMQTDGRPSDTFVATSSINPIPFGFTFDNYGHLAVTDAASSSLSTYSVLADGVVELIASQSDDGQAMCWVAQTDGNLYVADAGTDNLTGYHTDVAGKPAVFTKVDTRSGPIDLAATRDGRFLYVEVGGAGGVDGYRVNRDGTLTQIVTLSGLDGLEGIAAT
jgi:DNA-binding beta-propeller fold protein YncE